MNPLEQLRGDIGDVGPLVRARLQMEAGEAAEQRAADARAYEHAAKVEGDLMRMEARQRAERFAFGHTSEEAAMQRAEQEQRKAARVAELTDELARLAPELLRRSAHVPADRPIPAAPPGSREFVQALIARADRQRRDAESVVRQAEIARLEAQVYGRDRVTRLGGPITGVY